MSFQTSWRAFVCATFADVLHNEQFIRKLSNWLECNNHCTCIQIWFGSQRWVCHSQDPFAQTGRPQFQDSADLAELSMRMPLLNFNPWLVPNHETIMYYCNLWRYRI